MEIGYISVRKIIAVASTLCKMLDETNNKKLFSKMIIAIISFMSNRYQALH